MKESIAEQFEIKNNVLIKYHEKDGVTDVVIPEGVTTIGEGAFFKCRNLTSIIIPESLIIIENNAFSMCKNLKKIIIPDSVTEIGEYAFLGCDNLTEITIPVSVIEIDYDAFLCCNNIKTFNVPSYEIFNMLDDNLKVVALNTIIRDEKQDQYSKEDISKFREYIVKNKMNIFKSTLENSDLTYLLRYMLDNNIYTNKELNSLIADIPESDMINKEIPGTLLEYINRTRETKDIATIIDNILNLDDDDKDINEEEENENKRR